MDNRHNQLHFLIFVACLAISRPDIIEDVDKDVPVRDMCVIPREITGCNGTLLKNYKPPTLPIGIPDTYVYLYTSKNIDQPEKLHLCGGKLPSNTNFDPSAKTIILIPGYLDGICEGFWMKEFHDKYFKSRGGNVILVDWSWGSNLDPLSSAHNTRVVGEQIAFVVENIMNKTGIHAETIHIIGQSFGAHVAGFAGQGIPDLGRVTGLDPANVGFQDAPPDQRLDPSDAQLVDIIHGDSGDPPNLGYKGTLGHIDFYPNGGSQQPSCLPYAIKDFFILQFLKAVKELIIASNPISCSHVQPVKYFETSFRSCTCQFVGVECEDYESFKEGKCGSCGADGSKCAVMGLDLTNYPFKKDYRKYFLSTTLNQPHCNDIDLGGFPPVNQVC